MKKKQQSKKERFGTDKSQGQSMSEKSRRGPNVLSKSESPKNRDKKR